MAREPDVTVWVSQIGRGLGKRVLCVETYTDFADLLDQIDAFLERYNIPLRNATHIEVVFRKGYDED